MIVKRNMHSDYKIEHADTKHKGTKVNFTEVADKDQRKIEFMGSVIWEAIHVPLQVQLTCQQFFGK